MSKDKMTVKSWSEIINNHKIAVGSILIYEQLRRNNDLGGY